MEGIREMKRYKRLTTIIPDVSSKKAIFHDDYSGRGPMGQIQVDNPMMEYTEGEWVKWEDVEILINDHMTPMEIRMMGLLQSGLLNQTSAKCNCEENYNKGLGIWFCPAHGYKRR